MTMMWILKHCRPNEVEIFIQCTHPDSESYRANHHWWVAVWLCLRPRLCPHICQFDAPLFQGDGASLEVRLLIQHPTVEKTRTCNYMAETDNYMLEKRGRTRINVCGIKSVF